MQQYFIDDVINNNETISLDEDIVFHLSKVLRNTEKTFRLVDNNHKVFLAELVNDKAHILNEIMENNELDIDLTAVISTVKQDKFEIILQKLTELGVKKFIPIITSYSYNLFLNEKKIARFNKIIKEAAEQSHRNCIPQLFNPITIDDIDKFKSELNVLSYEKETNKDINLKCKSITYIIGPEGGFKKEEVDLLLSKGFISISLGNRILRSETAAICLTSNIIWSNK